MGVKYVKNSFGPLRDFRDLADANRQVRAWVMAEAGIRIHGTTRQQPLVRFTGTEQGLLLPLPSVAPELATWGRVKVHRDGHVQFERAYYSAPFRLAGKSLWLKATATMVHLYEEHILVATHLRQGARPQCRHRPRSILFSLVRVLFGDRVLIKLRAVQGLLRFAQQYSDERLEAACRRGQPLRHAPTMGQSSRSWPGGLTLNRRPRSAHWPPPTPKAAASAATPRRCFFIESHESDS